MGTKHKQSKIKVTPDSRSFYINVDKGLESIIKLLWKNGYTTNNSCINNQDKYVWICFDNFDNSVNDMIQFSNTNPELLNFLQDHCAFTLVLDGEEGPTKISLRFLSGYLKRFEKLMKETFRESKDNKDNFETMHNAR